MDEFKKDEILEEEEVAAEEATVTEATEPAEDVEETIEEAAEEMAEDTAEEIAEEKNELETELEEIRDMFQKELDAAREGNGTEMLIQELDEEAAPEEEEALPKCECCGENPCSQDFGDGYPYCDSCRETMKRYPLRFSGVLAIIVGIALTILTGYLSMSALDSSIAAADVIMSFESGKLMTALQSGYSYLSSSDPEVISDKVVDKMIEAYVKNGYTSDAVSLIETMYSESALKLPWNKKYQKIIDEATGLEETYFAVSAIIEPVANGTEYDYDELMAALEALKTADPKENNADATIDEYNKVFIDYYRYVLMNVNKKSLEEQLEVLKEIDKNGEGYEWVYLATLANIAARLGDEEAVNDAFERLTEINSEDSGAYIAKATYYRYLETPDADKILEICEEAAAHAYSGDLSYKQCEAIAYLLKGEAELALSAVEEVTSSGYTVQLCNLYALCGLYAGEEGIYDEMKSLLEGSGYEISDLVTQYKNGKITIEEIIADDGGDI